MIGEPTVTEQHADETGLSKEASVMVLYVAVCLLAALAAVDQGRRHGHVRSLAIIRGTTIGLAVAHAFAFRLSAQLVAHGAVRRVDAAAIAARLAGAIVVIAITIALTKNILSGH